MNILDSTANATKISTVIQRKGSLKRLYEDFYSYFIECLLKSPKQGTALEIGSGAGFLKEIQPDIVTSDILHYEHVDMVMDATKIPFQNNSLNALFLLNTLHHVSDSESLFAEISRCLMAHGRICIIDQYHGLFSKYVYKYLHHEPYEPDSKRWAFDTTGPLSGANGALCWIIFFRDRSRFEKLFPNLKITDIQRLIPLRYWLSGGLKWWSLLPEDFYNPVAKIDNWLVNRFPETASFVKIEIEKVPV